MEILARQRCLNHLNREAVARCPECQRFFCRECVTEHEDRLICAACLKKLAKATTRRRFRFANLAGIGQCLLGVLTAWLFFYFLGRSLLAIPDSFHEGTLWKSKFMDEP